MINSLSLPLMNSVLLATAPTGLALARWMLGPLDTPLSMPREYAPLAHFGLLCSPFPGFGLPRPLAHRQLAAAVWVLVVNVNLCLRRDMHVSSSSYDMYPPPHLNLRLWRALALPLPLPLPLPFLYAEDLAW